jgi:hypothetical protein
VASRWQRAAGWFRDVVDVLGLPLCWVGRHSWGAWWPARSKVIYKRLSCSRPGCSRPGRPCFLEWDPPQVGRYEGRGCGRPGCFVVQHRCAREEDRCL